jgi:hypothetical protein
MTSPETTDIVGTWSYTIGNPGAADEISCDVTIAGEGWTIACPIPGFPQTVGDACQETAEQWKLHGTLLDRLDGEVDREDTYAGDGCPALGYQTGLPVVKTMGILSATHDVRVPHDGFWSAVGGDWSFVALSPDNPLDQTTCTATLGALGDWNAMCDTGESTLVAPDCTETIMLGLSGHVGPHALDGSIYGITQHTGLGCDPSIYPPEVQSPPLPMSAMRR